MLMYVRASCTNGAVLRVDIDGLLSTKTGSAERSSDSFPTTTNSSASPSSVAKPFSAGGVGYGDRDAGVLASQFGQLN